MTLLHPSHQVTAQPAPPSPSAPAAALAGARQDRPDVVAAGVLCWRPARDGGVEVLVVHRPEHDDWTWPKGRPERREQPAECAVRSTAADTGVRVVLGRPLPPVRYALPDGPVKEVSYWAARVTGRHDPAARPAGRPGGRPGDRRPGGPTDRVDGARWLRPEEAAERLTHPADAAPLVALAALAAEGTLDTVATLVIRHATARPRDAWARADAERPLVASGRRQAMALGALLQCWRPDVVLSSPWRRCRETLDPYLAAARPRLRTKGGLSEAGHRRAPGKAARHVRSLLESAHGGALCTHRPVLEAVLDAVRLWCTPEAARQVPDRNPFLHPGDVLVAHVVHGQRRRPVVVAVERHGTR